VLCPELVGRDAEVERLRRRLDDLGEGRGGVVALVGDAGAGKTRLLEVAADAASAAGARVLAGRAVPNGSPLPYRPLREALLAAFRSSPPPDDPSLRGFEVHLARLVPNWPGAGAAEDAPILLAEAVVRLLAVVARDGGAVLLLEDVHWADAETLAVLDYFVDALRREPVLCVCTTRATASVEDLVGRLRRTDPDAVVAVGPLGEAEVDRMVGACLAADEPPGALRAFVQGHSDGNPFLVEELLAGLVASGELRRDADHWDVAAPLTPSVPSSLRTSIRQRLAAVGPDARRVLGAAALLGRQFPWELLPGIAEVDGRAAADALRVAVDEQLIEVDGDGFVFRHALTREAVLAEMLPPERRQLAARAWPVVERANPGLPGATCELAADLAEAAGDSPAAAARLVDSARRALATGALTTAEATARRAQRLAVGDEGVAMDADEVLVHVLVAAGKPADALALGKELTARVRERVGGARLVDLLVVLARAALSAGDLALAASAADEAAAAVAGASVPSAAALRARIDTVAGNVALDRGDLDRARALLDRALGAAAATEQPAVECEALLLDGRALRSTDRRAGRQVFERAAALAERANLPSWHLRAAHELALEAWTAGDPSPLRETRALAARYGAMTTVAVMDLSLADVALGSWDREECLRAATACVEASRRYGLATEPVANLWLAGAHALRGDDTAMQAATDAALAMDPDDPRILGDLHGRVLTTRAFVADDLGAIPPLVDTMMEHVRRAPPHTSIYPGRVLWALLHAIDDDDGGHGVRAEHHAVAQRAGVVFFDSATKILDAVILGRAGRTDEATALFDEVFRPLSTSPLSGGTFRAMLLFAAPAARRDGWGDPVRWLRDAEAFFTDRGYDRLARRCRAMLTDAGAAVPRRRGDTDVPAPLRALGVTGREVDVLRLVVAGRTNKQIAVDLVLSPKTVERHLSSLFTRLGVRDRRALADVGGAHLH
jgi:DNA-binding CsgD family transcriptional regulator